MDDTITANTPENIIQVAQWLIKDGSVDELNRANGVWHASISMTVGRSYRQRIKLLPGERLTVPYLIEEAKQLNVLLVDRKRGCEWEDGYAGSDEEVHESNMEVGWEFCLKRGYSLPKKKVKKLVDRTAEELIPLIGYIARKKRDWLYFMITSNHVFDQENMEFAPLGTEDWQPMQKEIEVDE
jgi:hypothetical protein